MPAKDQDQITAVYDQPLRPGAPSHACPQSLSGKKGVNIRDKKQMQFQSRKQMLRYIENFKLNYKTQLCRNFMEGRPCEFGEDCAYAHGYEELIVKPSPQQFNKNYKTKMCK